MIRHTTNATTRTRTASIRARREPLLQRGEAIASAETRRRYQIDRLIGQGGFGRLREQGHRIVIITEPQFHRLAAR